MARAEEPSSVAACGRLFLPLLLASRSFIAVLFSSVLAESLRELANGETKDVAGLAPIYLCREPIQRQQWIALLPVHNFWFTSRSSKTEFVDVGAPSDGVCPFDFSLSDVCTSIGNGSRSSLGSRTRCLPRPPRGCRRSSSLPYATGRR